MALGQTTVVRDLLVDADGLASPLVWSEVFAACDDPSTEVRWSQLNAVDEKRGRPQCQVRQLDLSVVCGRWV